MTYAEIATAEMDRRLSLSKQDAELALLREIRALLQELLQELRSQNRNH